MPAVVGTITTSYPVAPLAAAQDRVPFVVIFTAASAGDACVGGDRDGNVVDVTVNVPAWLHPPAGSCVPQFETADITKDQLPLAVLLA